MTLPRASILLADAQDVTRTNLATLLTAQNFRVYQAVDGQSGIRVLQDQSIDIVVVDPNSSPSNGFEIPRYIQGLNLPITSILMAQEQTSDLLSYARQLGVQHILAKPVDPKRLIQLMDQILNRIGRIKEPILLHRSKDETPLTHDQLMNQVIDLARKNVLGGFGGPFASVIADPNGYIIGTGTNLKSSRFDPFAHAEIMAIRQATEALQQTHLEGCAIYGTSEPTRLARALIDSVGLSHVYYGLRHRDIAAIRAMPTMEHHAPPAGPQIHILAADAVRDMILGLSDEMAKKSRI